MADEQPLDPTDLPLATPLAPADDPVQAAGDKPAALLRRSMQLLGRVDGGTWAQTAQWNAAAAEWAADYQALPPRWRQPRRTG